MLCCSGKYFVFTTYCARLYTVFQKKQARAFCNIQIRQILTEFQFFTGAFCGQFAIRWSHRTFTALLHYRVKCKCASKRICDAKCKGLIFFRNTVYYDFVGWSFTSSSNFCCRLKELDLLHRLRWQVVISCSRQNHKRSVFFCWLTDGTNVMCSNSCTTIYDIFMCVSYVSESSEFLYIYSMNNILGDDWTYAPAVLLKFIYLWHLLSTYSVDNHCNWLLFFC